MPTVEEFLQAVSPFHNTQDPTAECGICHGELNDPICTPCGHVFDRYCVLRWVMRHEQPRTCPLCRSVWVSRAGGRPRLEQMLGRAERWDRFGIPLGYPRSRAHEHEQQISGASLRESVFGAGDAVMQLRVADLAEDVVLFANLIIAQAVSSHAAMSTEQLGAWSRLVATVWRLVLLGDGAALPVRFLPAMLLEGVRDDYAAAGWEAESALVLEGMWGADAYEPRAESLGGRTRSLVLFVTWQAWQASRRRATPVREGGRAASHEAP